MRALTSLPRVRVLVAEDERRVADAVARGLRREGMAVDVAYDGAAALERLAVNDYDVVVLDRDLPGAPRRRRVPRRCAARSATAGCSCSPPRRRLDDRVDGLRARRRRLPAQAVRLRRAGGAGAGAGPPGRPAAPAGAGAGRHRLDPARRGSPRDGPRLGLSRKEFAVLEELLRADGAVVSARASCWRRRGTSTPTRSPTPCG